MDKKIVDRERPIAHTLSANKKNRRYGLSITQYFIGMEVVGYGGKKRIARVLSNTCMWGADGATPIPIRWVLVVDPTGKLDPLPLMSTDPLMMPEQMISLFIDRWGLEVTFEESREHLGVETQRQWSDRAIDEH